MSAAPVSPRSIDQSLSESVADGSIHLVGAGVVGREVAAAHLQACLPIHLYEVTLERLHVAIDWLRGRYPELQSDLLTTTPSFASVGARLQRYDEPAKPCSGPPIFIESIAERRDLKKPLLLAAQQSLGAKAILGTNTSTLTLRDLVDEQLDASRLVGLHFFMPVPQRPMVEVVYSATTSESTIAAAIDHVHRLLRVPLVVADSPGFIVNRMLAPYLNQALKALCAGASPEMIEHVALVAGMPMSPLELLDWIGMETGFHAGRAFWQAFPKRLEPAPLLPAMVKAKLLGRHHGKGFYDYSAGQRSAGISKEAAERIAFYAQSSRAWCEQTLTEWLFFPLLLEAVYLLREGVARNLAMIDLALMGGLGWTRSQGLRAICEPLTPSQLMHRIHSWGAEVREFEAPKEFLLLCSRVKRWEEVFAGMVSDQGLSQPHT